MPKIDNVNISFNDDDTYSYNVYFKPDKKKNNDKGGEQMMYHDSMDGSSDDLDDIFKKIKSGKFYPEESTDTTVKASAR